MKAKKAIINWFAKKQKTENSLIIPLKINIIGMVNTTLIIIVTRPILSIGIIIEKINNINEQFYSLC